MKALKINDTCYAVMDCNHYHPIRSHLFSSIYYQPTKHKIVTEARNENFNTLGQGLDLKSLYQLCIR